MSEDSPLDDTITPDFTAQQSNAVSTNGGPRNGAPSPNPRSCITCRRRKVKCDKKNPCSNCVRAKIDCIFPGPGRAPRKSRKPPDAELLERLRRLEGVVSSLNAQVEEHEHEAAERERQASTASNPCSLGNGGADASARPQPSVAVDGSVEGLENRFGRLVVEKGRSRYVNNSFWASLNNEVEDLKSILDEPIEDEEDVASPDSSSQATSHQAFIFNYNSVSVDMQTLRPGEQQALQYWAVYKENVDPLVKILHIPTVEPIILEAFAHPDKISKPLEPLLFAIYYGAVTSTDVEDCLQRWGEDRDVLLERYRFGLEQGLARANFLSCDEVIILQAFVIFLMLLRRNDAPRKIWTLTGLVVRIAQTLGVHRDGSHFKLSPFEIEMRRRLWWQVCILDARSSEDHGCDPTIIEAQFDTKMPLNINDSDIDPDMTEFPQERQGFTNMTFSLLRFEVANLFRRILYIPPGPTPCRDYFANLTIQDKEKWIADAHHRIEEKYLKHCDMSNPLCWVTATVSRLVMSKMWLVVYHPHQRKDGGVTLPQETRDKLFITSLENIEYSMLLETEARTMKWGWLFRTYVQWHAIAFLLSELCVRTKGEAVERAWRALETTAARWWFPLNDTPAARKQQPGCLWRPLKRLLAKAKAAREKEVTLERASAALRNGEILSFQYPRGLQEMQLPPLSVSQPTSESLDRMLRPTAPRLGDSSGFSPTSWPNSPPLPSGQLPMPQFNEPLYTQGQTRNPSGHNSSTSAATQSPRSQDFSQLLSFGIDNVIQEVLHDATLDGGPIQVPSDVNMGMNGITTTTLPQQIMTSNGLQNSTNGMAADLQAAHGTFGDSAFSNINFANLSPTMGQNDESPVMNDGSIDWTMWDDMVSQFGVDGQMIHPTTSTPAANIGLNWF